MSISKFNTFPFLRRHYWKGETGSQLRFTSTNSTITPALTVSGGLTPLWYVTESTGQVFKYEATSFSHTKTAGTGNLVVRLVNTEAIKDFVTGIDFNSDGIISNINFLTLQKFANLSALILYGNTNLPGDITTWAPKSSMSYIHIRNCALSGFFSSGTMTMPTSLAYCYLFGNYFTGGLAYWNLPSNCIEFRANDNTFAEGPRISVGSSAVANYIIYNNGMSQTAVDQIILDIYNNRANFTYATPTLNVGGTNAAPSGVYQDATPPTTGKEYIYKLVNDPDLEGFNKWTITYTA